MKKYFWILLCLLAGPGCVLNPFHVENEVHSGVPSVPPAPSPPPMITADQVNPQNAHAMTQAVGDELDWEESSLSQGMNTPHHK